MARALPLGSQTLPLTRHRRCDEATQNPAADLASVPLRYNYFTGGHSVASRFNLNVQPVLLLRIGKHWNLIARTIVPFSIIPLPDDRWATGSETFRSKRS